MSFYSITGALFCIVEWNIKPAALGLSPAASISLSHPGGLAWAGQPPLFLPGTDEDHSSSEERSVRETPLKAESRLFFRFHEGNPVRFMRKACDREWDERDSATLNHRPLFTCVCARARVRVYVCVCWKIIKTSYMLVRGPELQQCFNTKERKIMKSKSFHVLKAITWTCVNIPEFSRFIWLNTLHSVSLFPQDIGYCC